MRLLKAIAAFLVLPGVVGFVAPWMLYPRGAAFDAAGLVPMTVGIILLLWCVRDFYVIGRGTLAPWSPPTHLVEVGLYRVTRNPMYVAVLTILAGWAVASHAMVLTSYMVMVAVAVHLRVVLYEEPRLAHTFGEEFAAYRARVPRWMTTATAVRTFGIALAIGGKVAWREHDIVVWPVLSSAVLWFSLGGHFVELFFLRVLRPRLGRGRAAAIIVRVVTWFIGGVLLGRAALWTLNQFPRTEVMAPVPWWAGGALLVVIELVMHLMLVARKRPSMYDEMRSATSSP